MNSKCQHLAQGCSPPDQSFTGMLLKYESTFLVALEQQHPKLLGSGILLPASSLIPRHRLCSLGLIPSSVPLSRSFGW